MGQSIRKNHNEMTNAEKDALVAAFVYLEDNNIVFDDLWATHSNSFVDIHFNLRTTGGYTWEPQIDVFFPWHRRQILELEQAMQEEVNAKISIPYWDWTVDNSVNDGLWDSDFMGGFDINGHPNEFPISRSLGNNSSLPTSSAVSNVQNINPGTQVPPYYNYYVDYSAALENGKVHTGGHEWVGGTMVQRKSPADPIFYLHHGMVDKLWQDWIEDHGFNSGDQMYTRTDMPRYDGTVSGISSVNPDDLLDSKSIGVFYAANGLAELYDYTVGQITTGINPNSEEVFYYQYTIEAKDNFIVPSGKDAVLESVNEVILKPGFHAQNGSTFTAKIDTNPSSPLRVNTTQDPIVKNRRFLNYRVIEKESIYSQEGIKNLKNAAAKILVDHKRKDNLELEIKEPCEPCEIEVVNAKNIPVLKRTLNQGKNIDINLSQLEKGTHFLNVTRNNVLIFNKELEKL